MKRTPTYYSWCSMISRCENPRHHKFQYYGARGVKICPRWKRFANFIADMGTRPRGTTIDRFPDNQGNYRPGNCRWATHEEQQNNKTNNHRIEWHGRTMTMTQWAKHTGLNQQTLSNRIVRGWTIHRALSERPRKKAPRRTA